MKQAFKLLSISLLILGSACSTDKSHPANTAAPAPTPPASVTAAPQGTTQTPGIYPTPPLGPQVPPQTQYQPDDSYPSVPATPAETPAAPVSASLNVLSINGLAADDSGAVNIYPGESVTLVADVLTTTANCQTADTCTARANLGVDQFTWSADDSSSDICDAANAALCSRTSNFSISGNSITFRVPLHLRGDITISVRQTGSALVGGIILKPTQQPGGGIGGIGAPVGGIGGIGGIGGGRRGNNNHSPGSPNTGHGNRGGHR